MNKLALFIMVIGVFLLWLSIELFLGWTVVFVYNLNSVAGLIYGILIVGLSLVFTGSLLIYE